MFNGWLIGLNKKLMYKILVGASAVCWAIWLSRNYMVFNNYRAATPLQVIFRGTHWIRFWALLQKENKASSEAANEGHPSTCHPRVGAAQSHASI
jgi:hypothetical protein